MKRFIGLVAWLPLSIGMGFAQNLVFNPGFDMTPWDTGWTIEKTTYNHSWNGCTTWTYVSVEPDLGMSPPNSCLMKAEAGIDPTGESVNRAIADILVSQFFNPINHCEIKAYIKFYIDLLAKGEVAIQGDSFLVGEINIEVYKLSGWEKVWGIRRDGYWEDTLVNNWVEITDTINDDNIYGIRFSTHSRAASIPDWWGAFIARTYFWVDNISIISISIEEEPTHENTKLSVFPNPFTKFTTLQGIRETDEYKVYDLSGKLVEKTKGKTFGQNLPCGVYFIKIRGFTPIKITKIGG